MKATITQQDGVSLSIEPVSAACNQLVTVRLVGTKLSSEIIESLELSFEGMDSLPALLRKAALGQKTLPAEWQSQGVDLVLNVSNESLFEGFLSLRVYIASTSDDAADWQVNATLLVTPEQLLSFAEAVDAM